MRKQAGMYARNLCHNHAKTSGKTQPEGASLPSTCPVWGQDPLSLPAVERAGPRVVPRGNSSRLTRADSSA